MSLKKDLLKYTPRKVQQEAIDFIDFTISKNPTNKFFLLNMPVGTGKSHLALMIADWYKKRNRMARVDIITNSKILQDQYSNTYSSISDLKGKENYDCKSYACSCAQGAEFNRLNKTSCEECPYSTAREGFINGGVSLTNFYLYILYAMYNQKLMDARDARVLIIDECHELEEVMSSFISIKITETIIKKFDFSNERDIISRLKQVNSISSYVDFLGYLNNEIVSTMEQMEKGLLEGPRDVKKDKRDLKLTKVLKSEKNPDVKIMNLITDLNQYKLKIEVFLTEYKENPDNWILEQGFNEKTRQKELSLEPIWANDYLDKYIFSHYDMVFLMSGTILDKKLFCDINGLDVDKAAYHSIESPFLIKNRPIIYMPLGKMSYAKKEETFQRYIPYIKKILNKYAGQKGVIHTNSFELSNWIQKSIKDSRLIFHDSSNKDEMLRMHFETDKPTVLVSPSVHTGVSFDDDLARFQIIAKVPYPSLASQKNKMRQSLNPDWYAWKTCSSIQQSCGRVVRSGTDYADTIIIDGSFGDVMKHSYNFLPDWFQESIKRVNVKIT